MNLSSDVSEAALALFQTKSNKTHIYKNKLKQLLFMSLSSVQLPGKKGERLCLSARQPHKMFFPLVLMIEINLSQGRKHLNPTCCKQTHCASLTLTRTPKQLVSLQHSHQMQAEFISKQEKIPVGKFLLFYFTKLI